MNSSAHIMVTKRDLARLQQVIDAASGSHVDALDDELARAEVVEPSAIPSDVVTMNSTVRFRDEVSGEQHEVTLTYPQQADATKGKVSVLAPVGCALLGLRVGQSIDWPMPNGRSRRLKIVELVYQPEASGHFDL